MAQICDGFRTAPARDWRILTEAMKGRGEVSISHAGISSTQCCAGQEKRGVLHRHPERIVLGLTVFALVHAGEAQRASSRRVPI